MKYFLGIDGGGSKTECVLADASGAMVARAAGPGTNLRRTSSEALRAILNEIFQQLWQAAGLPAPAPAAAGSGCDAVVVCAGFAGAGREEPRERARTVLQELLQPRALTVVGDMEVALEAAAGGEPGVVLVSGTGSIAYGRNATGKTARAGGEGPEQGDAGSGYAIGRAAIEAVLRERENQGAETELRRRIQEAVKGADAEALAGLLTPERAAELAALVSPVAEAARAGDQMAQGILRRAVPELAELAHMVLQELALLNDPVMVATAGGAFAAAPELLAGVRAELKQTTPLARVQPLTLSPAEGAARRARRFWLQHDQNQSSNRL